MILDRVKALAKRRYSWRSDDVVYAHMLTVPIRAALSDNGYNGYMAIGELVHLGVERVLDPAPQMCRIVMVDVDQDRVVDDGWRFLFGEDSPYAVTVCGTADGMYNDAPVEVKTTRSGSRSPSVRWMLQAALYAWLYTAGIDNIAYLVVINLVDAREAVWTCRALRDRDVERLVEHWLYGEDPVSVARPLCEKREETRIEEPAAANRSLDDIISDLVHTKQKTKKKERRRERKKRA